jgi:eukaryotic-like serine/threonine-protein kinase
VKVASRRRERERATKKGLRGYVAERRLIGWILAVGLGAFLLGYAATTVAFFPGFGRSAIVTVPDVRGLPAADARRALDRAGLEVEDGGAFPNPRVAPGAVLMQVPLPGEEVARGSPVRIVMSGGAELRALPEVEGRDANAARALLERMGWEVTEREERAAVREGTVVAMVPAAGTEVPVGSAVELVVSAGPPRVEVPEVTGFTREVAASRLQAVGLRLGSVEYDPYATVPPGTVARQSPEAGASLRMGGAVGVVVAGWDPAPAPPAWLEEPPEPQEEPEEAPPPGLR